MPCREIGHAPRVVAVGCPEIAICGALLFARTDPDVAVLPEAGLVHRGRRSKTFPLNPSWRCAQGSEQRRDLATKLSTERIPSRKVQIWVQICLKTHMEHFLVRDTATQCTLARQPLKSCGHWRNWVAKIHKGLDKTMAQLEALCPKWGVTPSKGRK